MTRGKAALFGRHGGGLRFEVAGCDKLALGKSGMTKAKAKQLAIDEASKPRVNDEVKKHVVNELFGKHTGDAARSGLRPIGHVASMSDAAKTRILFQKGRIGLSAEEKKQRRSMRACCNEQCKKYYEVHITEEWVGR